MNPRGLVSAPFRSVPIGSMAWFRVFQSGQTVVWLIPSHTIAQSRDLVTDRSVVAHTVKLGVRIKIQEGLPPWFVFRFPFSPETPFKSEFTFRLNSWMRAGLRGAIMPGETRRAIAPLNHYAYATRTKRRREFTTKVQQVRIPGRIPESARSGSQATQRATMAYLRRGCFTIGTGSMSTERKRGSNGDKKKKKTEKRNGPKEEREKRKRKREEGQG